MTRQNLVTGQGTVTLAEAEKILMANKVEKLLLVDEDYTLTGLITIKDIDMQKRFPQACKDKQGRLRVGAAIGFRRHLEIRRVREDHPKKISLYGRAALLGPSLGRGAALRHPSVAHSHLLLLLRRRRLRGARWR
jgi:hypothetical protein